MSLGISRRNRKLSLRKLRIDFISKMKQTKFKGGKAFKKGKNSREKPRLLNPWNKIVYKSSTFVDSTVILLRSTTNSMHLTHENA